MGCEATPEGGPAARIAASYLGSGYRVFRGVKKCVDTYAHKSAVNCCYFGNSPCLESVFFIL